MHVGQSAIKAVVPERQLLMINAQEVQDRCVQIVAVRFAFGGLIAEFVALSVGCSGLDARPGPEKWVVDAWCGVVDTGRYPSRGEAAMRLLKIHKEWFDRPDRSPITHRALSEQLRVIDGPGKRVVGLVRGRIVPLLGIGESVADVVALQFDCTELSEEKEELCC